MSRVARVSWKDGMFLAPHHFQQLERQLNADLQLRLAGENPDAWGVLHCELSETAVVQGRLEILRLQAILPDGTPINIPEADAPPVARRIPLNSTGNEILVFLGLPLARPKAPLITTDLARGDVRFREQIFEVGDDGNPTEMEVIEVGVKNLRIVFAGELMEGLVILPLARIRRTAESTLALDQEFIPPCLRLQGAPALVRLSQGIAGRVLARARSLAATRFPQGLEYLDPSGPDAVAFWFFHALNQHAGLLLHLLEQPSTTPSRLFELLLQLYSALSSFSGKVDPGPSSLYRHADPGPAFVEIDRRLQALLTQLFPTRYEAVPLTKRDAFWVGRLSPQWTRPGTQLFLMVTGDMPAEELVSRLPAACKIADPETIGALVRTAVGGVRIRPVMRPPAPIPVRRDAAYFQILTDAREWEGVRGTGMLALYLPSWLPGLNLELVGLTGTEEGQRPQGGGQP